MKFARLTRVAFTQSLYRDASVWINFDLVVGMSNAAATAGGGAYIKVLLVDTTPTVAQNPVEGAFGEPAQQLLATIVNNEWQMDSQVGPGPNSGRMRLNTAVQAQSTLSWLHYTTIDSLDMKAALQSVRSGATLDIVQKGDTAKSAKFTVNGPPVDRGTYIELPVQFVSGGAQLIAQRVVVTITQDAVPPATVPTMKLLTVQVKETVEQILALIA